MLQKIMQHIREHGALATIAKVSRRAPAYLAGISSWEVRLCECCQRKSIFMSNTIAREFKCCCFCGANERYELLAREIRGRFGGELKNLRVLELDPHSPLRGILSQAKEYYRSFYSKAHLPGQTREDGARCEDITRLTFSDSSLDLVVSSDVLEHVADLEQAFIESARVLVPGGVHLFTVPTREATTARAIVRNGEIYHLLEPEYHLDPLNASGVLAFWDVGPDLGKCVSVPNLEITMLLGPIGPDKRIVWAAICKMDS